jgi:hypothetical protein
MIAHVLGLPLSPCERAYLPRFPRQPPGSVRLPREATTTVLVQPRSSPIIPSPAEAESSGGHYGHELPVPF